MRQLYDPISIVLGATALFGAFQAFTVDKPKVSDFGVSTAAADKKAEDAAKKEVIAEQRRARAGATGTRQSLLTSATPASDIDSRKATLGSGV